MTDVLSTEQRRFCMSRIRDKNTKPEIVVRQLVRQMGIGYRLHVKDLPGKPDLVFRKHKKIIFVHGCFWHMHACKYGRVVPKTNAEFWQLKRLSNKLRDTKNKKELKKLGWSILVIWECQTREQSLLLKKIQRFFPDLMLS
jgi:DNA mismatch endonuclease (patch repair protein)